MRTTLEKTIEEYIKFFQERGYNSVIRRGFKTPEGSASTFTFCSGMFYEEFYKGNACEVPDKEIVHQYCIRTDSFYKLGHSPKHLMFFNMLGLFEFGEPDAYSCLANILLFLTNTVEPANLRINVPDSLRNDKKLIGIIERYSVTADYREDEKLLWQTSLQTPYHGIRLEINYVKDFLRVELWNISLIRNDCKGVVAVDSGMCAERLNLAQNRFNTVYESDEFVMIHSRIRSLPKRNKPYYLLASTDSPCNTPEIEQPELNLLADLVRATMHLVDSGVEPSGKQDRKGMHLRTFLKKICSLLYVNGYDIARLPELYGKNSELIRKEIELFYGQLKLGSLDAAFAEVQGTIKFADRFKGDKYFRNHSRGKSEDEIKQSRRAIIRATSLDELSKLTALAPLEILVDWVCENGINLLPVSISAVALKEFCDSYKINLLTLRRAGLLK